MATDSHLKAEQDEALFIDNRFGLGAKGSIGQSFFWKGMLTYVRKFGTYAKRYNHNNKYIFGLLKECVLVKNYFYHGNLLEIRCFE